MWYEYSFWKPLMKKISNHFFITQMITNKKRKSNNVDSYSANEHLFIKYNFQAFFFQ